jgi:hypothetical protein
MLWLLYTPLQKRAARAASTAVPPSCSTSLKIGTFLASEI